MLATNKTMMDLLTQLGPARIVDRETCTVEVEIPNASVIAAEHDVAAPFSPRTLAQR
jgi:hypothetical protein